ncbi:hypothetical protein [Thalassospira xiamenensis]|jgi:hypothetical protein|uniref:hypothetical protein n=1 Tax=Thalassospira xiamenensis TaxID=220697 RepID=UPI00241C4C48|nr:hypothetical protein [Thalassospira xiamenensis]|tara:strand:+ start:1959 stop:2567 length:609 start_codon:yes stop_codon:yes gene_type:complete
MTTIVMTMSGRKIDLLSPKASDIYWPDVCFALSNINRYTGHTKIPVAQHSVIVADLVSAEAEPYALIHDAKEYITGDTSTPEKDAERAAFYAQFPIHVRNELQNFHSIRMGSEIVEDMVDEAIHIAAGLQWPAPDHIAREVKRADQIALATESRDNLPEQVGDLSIRPLSTKVMPMTAGDAQHLFTNRIQVTLPVFLQDKAA